MRIGSDELRRMGEEVSQLRSQHVASQEAKLAAQRQAAREARAHALLARLFAEKKAEIEARYQGRIFAGGGHQQVADDLGALLA
ncbi:MAG: hypothetical protein EBX53_04960, partial [Betaproteobacteria bacterium]|nr:hypothetical protein [Betaproteobacteria bacterium]